MIDGHMHLEYGPLTKEYVMEFVEQAQVMGLTKIQILDHTHRFKEFNPIYKELKENNHYQKEWLDKKELLSLTQYHHLIEEIKAMNLPIEVSFGLEVCYVPKHKEFLKDILNQYPYDFLIGSIHSIDGILYDMPFSKELLWDKFDVNHIYKRYYELVFDLIESDLFTQLGHPDTIKMNHYYPDYNLVPTYQKLAKLLVQHNVKAENNTGCHYRYNHEDIGLSNELLKILKENKVQMITASDAHYPQHVGKFIKEINDITMKKIAL